MSSDLPQAARALEIANATSYWTSVRKRVMDRIFVATKEDWNELWHSVHHAVGGVSSLFFIALVVVGPYLLMNMIVATLIGDARGTRSVSAGTDGHPPAAPLVPACLA